MILFLLTFFCLYGGINFYFFFRARNVLHICGPLQAVCLIVLVTLILAPVITRTLETYHYEHAARLSAYIGYIWMAFVFLFFFLSISMEVIRGIHKLIVPETGTVALKAATFWLAALLAAGLVVYGYIDAQRLRVKNLQIRTDQIFPSGEKLRIVQISDVHVGIINHADRLEPLLAAIRQAKPDMLICTGDLLDEGRDNVMENAPAFAALAAPFGKFAIFGNHEYYAGIDHAAAFIRAAGFKLLRDDVVQSAGITIFGEDDVTGHRLGETAKSAAFRKRLSGDHDGFVLLLRHQPFITRDAQFHLQLSGHTHDGQIFPFGMVVRFYFSKMHGLYELAAGQQLYVSRGAGTWGPPVRVFAPPEITVIDLIGRKQ